MAPTGSRLETARRRLRTARHAVAAGAAGVFVAVLLLARASHPASAHASTASSAASQGAQQVQPSQSDDSFGFGFSGGSFGGSSGSAPQVQSGGS